MNVKNVEKKEKNTAVVTVEISGAEFEAAINKVYNKVKGQITLPGFRKGKAPRRLVEKMYGANVFYEDAMEELYPAVITEITKDESLTIVGYPQTKIDTIGKDGVEMTVTVGLMPEVTLGQYKGIPAPKAEVSVTQEEEDTALKPFIDRATTQEVVDRPIQNGDIAVIDFEGFTDGVAFEGGKGENHELKIGSGSFIPGFEEQLIGVSAGESKDVTVTFPAEYHAAELAGKEAVFHCLVHEVKSEMAPELDDEFAKDVSEFETLDELKADLKAKALARKEEAAQNDFQRSVMTAVINNAGLEVPDTMVEYETDRTMEDFENRVKSLGITLDQYLNMMGTNRTEYRITASAGALRRIQEELILKAVAEAEGLEASEEEIAAHVKSLSEQYEMTEEQVHENLTDDALARQVKMEKASKLIYDSAVPTALVETAAPAGEEEKDAEKAEKKAAKEAEKEAKKAAKETEKAAKKAEAED